jgi:hypothetical protein
MSVILSFGNEISGWVRRIDEHDKIEVKVNGRTVAETNIGRLVEVDGEMKPFGFSVRIKDLWSFIGKGDEIAVAHNGMPLPLPEPAKEKSAELTKPSRIKEAFDKIENGFVLDKKGEFRRRIDQNDRFQNTMFEILGKLRPALKEKFGVDLTIFYGTLLGCVRSGKLIKHDDDFDVIYISRKEKPDDVTHEYLEICQFLIELGYKIEFFQHHFRIIDPLTWDLFDIF